MIGIIPYLALAYCLGSPPTPNYEKVNANVSVSVPKNTAVLLIDMQPDFVQAISGYELTREVPNMLRVLEYAAQNRLPIFVLEYHDHPPTIDFLKKRVDVLPNVSYVVKPYDNGFADTGLAVRLKQLNVDEVVLMGINASFCVASTAQGAKINGFHVTTSLDLIADPSRLGDMGIGVEGSRWFARNGTLAKDHKDLLELISQRQKGVLRKK